MMAAGESDPGHVRLVRRQRHVLGLATVAIFGITAMSVRNDFAALAWVGVALLVLASINQAINRSPPSTRRARIGRALRPFVNGGALLLLNHRIGWPLPAWLWLPYLGVTIEGGRKFVVWSVLLGTSVVWSAVAVRDGIAWSYPLCFMASAILVRLVTDMRLDKLNDIIRRSEHQRTEIDFAHSSLQIAHDQLHAALEAQERAQLELRQAHKLEAVGRLAAGIAHEINTPLQYALHSADFVRESAGDLVRAFDEMSVHARTGQGEAALARIEEKLDLEFLRVNLPDAGQMVVDGLTQIATIVDSMRAFMASDDARIEVDLNRAVTTALEVARREYDAVADVTLELGDIPLVECFPGAIHQVLLNLLLNAAHAIAEMGRPDTLKGVITVRTRFETEDDAVLVSIADDGTGISEAVRDKIFEPFFTTKPVGKGTGQGLSISRTIVVDRHGGKLSFESEAGKGATFFLRLPRARHSEPGRT
jgi:signal transduction histidine kinase